MGVVSQAMLGNRRSLVGAALQQVVFQRVPGRGGSGGDPQLAVDRAHMRIDGDQTNDELLGNLRAGQALSQQSQHLHLASGQASRRGGWYPHWRSR